MENGDSKAKINIKEKRPWGSFEILHESDSFKIKKISVEADHQLSYQSHSHRSEHWVVVKGSPEVVFEDKSYALKEGDHFYIPAETKHRIRNKGKVVVEIIEVQLGTDFGEDDIVRYEDDYNRK